MADFKFTDHAKQRCDDYEVNPLLVASLLLQPYKLLGFKQRDERFRLEFEHTPRLSVIVVVRFTDEDLYIITNHKETRSEYDHQIQR